MSGPVRAPRGGAGMSADFDDREDRRDALAYAARVATVEPWFTTEMRRLVDELVRATLAAGRFHIAVAPADTDSGRSDSLPSEVLDGLSQLNDGLRELLDLVGARGALDAPSLGLGVGRLDGGVPVSHSTSPVAAGPGPESPNVAASVGEPTPRAGENASPSSPEVDGQVPA